MIAKDVENKVERFHIIERTRTQRRLAWIANPSLRRKNWQPTEYSCVCSVHFISGGIKVLKVVKKKSKCYCTKFIIYMKYFSCACNKNLTTINIIIL